MAKRQHRQNILRYEVFGIVMLFFSALALGRLGWVGRLLDVAFVYLAGSWSFLVPIFVLYTSLYIMVQRAAFPWTYRHVGLLILLVTWLTAIEMDFYQRIASLTLSGQVPLFTATMNAIDAMQNVILHPQQSASLTGDGGGLIGYAFFSAAHSLFGDTGTKLLIGVGVLIGLALVTQRSLVAGVQKGTRWMERRLESLWKGSMQYASMLFGPEPKSTPKASMGSSIPKSSSRKKPRLIVEGEIADDVSESPVADSPIIHDYARHKADVEFGVEPKEPPAQNVSHDGTAPIPVEMVGNQMVMKFPDRAPDKGIDKDATKPGAASSAAARGAKAVEPYAVGAPVRDENYRLPPVRMFALPKGGAGGFSEKSALENARKLEMTLESFGVQAKVLEISRGPTVTRYEVQPAFGVKVSRIVNLSDDIALALAARGIRMEAPVPGKSVIGIEVPNPEVSVVTLRQVLESTVFQEEESKLALALGRDITGAPIVGNLQKMPHLLVAGATGSGKSVCINGIIASILVKAKPHETKFLMIDPKMVELSGYNGIPHLLAPVVTDPSRAAFALKKIVQEMEQRYQSFADRGARDLERYNDMLVKDGLDPLPYIVVIIDELADLMMVAPGDVEDCICRIAQKARAAGIHLIVATQRPSVDVITGLIKANIPSRIAFAVSSMADSRTILDGGGAEKLLGRGDMLYLPAGANKPVRVQGAFVSDKEIEKLVEYVKDQQNAVYTVDLNHSDENSESSVNQDLDNLFVDAVDLVVDVGQASTSMLQRRFRIGYSRASRIVDQMEQQNLVGRFEGSKPREVLVTAEQWSAMRKTFAGESQ